MRQPETDDMIASQRSLIQNRYTLKPVRYLLFLLCVTSIYARTTPQTPADGVADLLKGLERAETASHSKESLEGCLVSVEALGSDLDMFELRYGSRPASAPGWNQVKARASVLLGAIDKQHENDAYYNRDSANTAICVLLELAGREKEALARLDSIKPGGGCGNWVATVVQAVEQRRAGIYQRIGDYAAALSHEEAARAQEGLSLYQPAADLDGVRYGFLLEKTRHAKKAIPVYQRIVDLFPNSKGTELAAQRLTALHALITPTAQRIVQVYIEAKKGRDYDGAIFALAGHKFPESFDLLVAQLKVAKGWQKNRIIPALGELGDKRAISILREVCSVNDDWINHVHAVGALHRLGDDSEIVPMLELAAKSDNRLDQDFTDQILRQVYGDGPKIENTWEIKPAEFARTWTEWIRGHQAPVVSA